MTEPTYTVPHAACGRPHRPGTPCPTPDRTGLLAEEARHLAGRVRDLQRRVAAEVDRDAARLAADAAVGLHDLADRLDGGGS